jgi:hypothetical protein
VFVPGNLGEPPPQVKFHNNRLIGAVVLLLCLILCLALVIGLDTLVIVPHNATVAVTQTWQAAHPEAATAGPGATRRPGAAPSATPGNFDLNAANELQKPG